MKRVGLALGGGVVRGFAHVGVLMALEEAGIRADVVTGTSVGSIVGAFVAAGYDAPRSARLQSTSRGEGWRDWPGPWRGGWVSFYKLEQFVNRTQRRRISTI
jgi:NTE family protein